MDLVELHSFQLGGNLHLTLASVGATVAGTQRLGVREACRGRGQLYWVATARLNVAFFQTVPVNITLARV